MTTVKKISPSNFGPASITPRHEHKSSGSSNSENWDLVHSRGDEKAEAVLVRSKQRATNGAKGTSGKNRGKSKGGSLPPQIDATPTFRHTFRFANQSSSVSVNAVTGNNLGGAAGCVCYVANTTARSIVGTMRIHKITVWPSQDASAIANVADCRWAITPSNIGKDVDMIENLPLGVTVTKPVIFRPPAQSLAGFWFSPGGVASTTLFTLELSEGSIVDFDCSYTCSNNQTGATVTLAVTVAIGTFGYTPLNGSGGGLIPLGLAQTF